MCERYALLKLIAWCNNFDFLAHAVWFSFNHHATDIYYACRKNQFISFFIPLDLSSRIVNIIIIMIISVICDCWYTCSYAYWWVIINHNIIFIELIKCYYCSRPLYVHMHAGFLPDHIELVDSVSRDGLDTPYYKHLKT